MTKISPYIVVYPPGPQTRQLVIDDHRVITHSAFREYPLSAVSGRGCFITDMDGNTYIDFTSGHLCTSLGFSHPEVVEAVRNQANRLISFSYQHSYSPLPVKLAEELIRETGEAGDKMVYFGASTEDAIETAVKIAQWYSRNQVLLSITGSYFGETSISLALSSDKAFKKRHFPPSPTVYFLPSPYCYRCPLHLSPESCSLACLSYFEEEILQKIIPPEDVAAIFFEPIMVNAGCILPPKGYFQKLQEIANKNSIVTVANESNTCMGRTGSWYALAHWSIHPDIIVTSNSLAEGLPLSAVVSKASIIDWARNSHSTTMGGNLLACAASLKAIEILKKDHLLENANREGMYLKKQLTELQKEIPEIGDVRGRGLIVGAEVIKATRDRTPAKQTAREVVKKCWRRGLLLQICGTSTLQLTPPLTVTRELIDQAVEILEGAFSEVLS